jgi:hypothetical protein
MCKEMPVILVSKVVDLKKNNWKKLRAEEEEERHKGSLTKKNVICVLFWGAGRYLAITEDIPM